MKNESDFEKYYEIAQITDKILSETHKKLGCQKSEQDVIELILKGIRSRKLSPSFPPFVASGKHTLCLKQDEFTLGNLKKGFLLIDFGINYKGINSDMTRIFYLGNPTSQELNDYQLVKTLQEKAINNTRYNVKFSELDVFLSKNIEKGKYLVGRLGHGIGKKLQQHPSVRGDDVLLNGSVFTIEPALYFEDEGYGIRIEDMVLLKNNIPVVLTKFKKNIEELTIPFEEYDNYR